MNICKIFTALSSCFDTFLIKLKHSAYQAFLEVKRDDYAQLGGRLPANLSDVVEQLLGVRFPVETFEIQLPFNE